MGFLLQEEKHKFHRKITFAFSGYNLDDIPTLHAGNIDKYPNIKARLRERLGDDVIESIENQGGKVNLFKVMKYTDMNVANHTLSHFDTGERKEGRKVFRHLPDSWQNEQFGVNQALLAKVIKESGVDPEDLLTNYARISNSPPKDPAEREKLYERLNGLGLKVFEGGNMSDKKEVGDYVQEWNTFDVEKKKEKAKEIARLFENKIKATWEKGRVPAYYLHLHNESGRMIFNELVILLKKHGIHIESMPNGY